MEISLAGRTPSMENAMREQHQPVDASQRTGSRTARLDRRRFLAWGTGGLLAAAAVQRPWAVWAAKKTADSTYGRIVITGIEEHEVNPNYRDWLLDEINRYQGPRSRTVYVVHTNKGLHGLGEGSPEKPDVREKYIGTSPFDWVGDETSIPMAKAVYDLMGKAAGVPVYKLFASAIAAGFQWAAGPWPAIHRKWRTPFEDTPIWAIPG